MDARFVRHCASAITLTVDVMHHFKTLLIIALAIAGWIAMVIVASLTVLIVSPLLSLARFVRTRRVPRHRSAIRTPLLEHESTQY